MAISTVAQVRTQSNSIGSARLLLVIIASHISPVANYAWPSVPCLAREGRLSERTIYRLITKLEASGELQIHRRPGRVNRYRILLGLSTDPRSADPTPATFRHEPPDSIPSDERSVKERKEVADQDAEWGRRYDALYGTG